MVQSIVLYTWINTDVGRFMLECEVIIATAPFGNSRTTIAGYAQMIEASNRCLALITLNFHPIRIARIGEAHLWIETIIVSSRQFKISL